MSASDKRRQTRFQKRDETFFFGFWQVVVVKNPGSPLYQDRAMDPPDEGMVQGFMKTRQQLQPIGTRTNGTRVLQEGDPWLEFQRFDKDYDPSDPLTVGSEVPNHEVLYGRGRTFAIEEAVRRLIAEGKIKDNSDMLFIESKRYSDISDAEALEIIAIENEHRRATTRAERIGLAMRSLKANNGDVAAVAIANSCSVSTIKNWQKLWNCHPCVLQAVSTDEIGEVLAWRYFPDVPREKHEELLRLFRASGARKGADAESTMVRLVDQVLGRKPAPAPAPDAAPASHTRASEPLTDPAARAPATPPAHQTRNAPTSDIRKPAASGAAPAPASPPVDNVASLPKARDVHALRRGATGCRDASKAAKEVNPLEARDLKIAALMLLHASGKDDALTAFPHITAAMNGTYSPKRSATEEPTGS